MAAPLIVFAYNRPDHLKKTLTALSENPEARVSELFLFVDGPKNEAGLEANRRVREVRFGVFSLGYDPRGVGKQGPGAVGDRGRFGGIDAL